jgi:phosphoribosylformylglycinamidine cyclo-ligase
MTTASKEPMDYRSAGVDIDAGERLVNTIKPDIARTLRPGVLGGIGGFGGLFEMPAGYRQPVLVSGTDGVGTKLMLAELMDDHSTIGVDLVAMCVNDILVCGAEPLFFLDYYATGKLSVDKSAAIIAGIADGCVQAGAALIGGETAEMPGLYSADEYDLAGFAVGVVEKDAILDSSSVKAGDQIIGLASSGLHSNGYSLARKVLEVSGAKLDQAIADTTLGQSLLQPTRIYVKSLLQLLSETPVKSLAHITGGGLTENLPRAMPEGTAAVLDTTSWTPGDLFDWLQASGNISTAEMRRTFNCGIGMAIIVAPHDVERSRKLLEAYGETTYLIGEVVSADNTGDRVTFSG